MNPQAAATLRAARTLIADPIHWTKGQFARNAKGRVVKPSSKSAICWCSLGALYRASGSFDFNEAAVCLQYTVNGGMIAPFNDDPTTTHADILQAFDAAILLAETAP